jgi:cytochrome c-type biogenesis protein CcmH/NrfF
VRNNKRRAATGDIVSLLAASIVTINCVLAAPVSPAEIELQSKDVFVHVMSPFCEGRTLNDCPSSQAQKLKDEIRAEVASGKDAQTVMNELFVKYGETYRASPKASGFGLLAWLAPVLVFIAGGGFLLGFLLKSAKKDRNR